MKRPLRLLRPLCVLALAWLVAAPAAADENSAPPARSTHAVRIGTVGVSRKNNGSFDYHVDNRGLSVELTFSKKALMNAGLLTGSTDELTLTGDLTNGIEIVSHVNVNVTTR